MQTTTYHSKIPELHKQHSHYLLVPEPAIHTHTQLSLHVAFVKRVSFTRRQQKGSCRPSSRSQPRSPVSNPRSSHGARCHQVRTMSFGEARRWGSCGTQFPFQKGAEEPPLHAFPATYRVPEVNNYSTRTKTK